ncbi:SDR family NAD(P)-dependent oxidoreductase [Jidongwangia harbinensis]|uniref:SDR family NAD(P)-dependent oxidoreductase n=1 Tax=Jidongwangia harbinensis TaxID=2878561 RepID=UPI001CD9BEB9|nr:SDR family NAD(P)-dependent oxidoreductase [Jidongwangia harbinensis]MCA2216178.1 SDR family NAD(P)-dependent oxidoreductase [Jidongwangia harbinensis]
MAVIIVTGASSGIGRATADRLGRTGNTIVLTARRAAELAEVARRIESNGGTALVVPADVRDPGTAGTLVDRTLAATGRIDALVNNAGVGGSPSVLADDAEVDAMLDVNLRAPIRLMRAVVPIMRAQGAGSIVNIGSVAGEIGLAGVYSATKFALRGLTDSVRRELAGTGIAVTLIEPGFIATPLTRRTNLPGPEIVADAVEKALRRPRRRMVFPVKYRLAMTAASTLPFLADRILAGRAAERHERGR